MHTRYEYYFTERMKKINEYYYYLIYTNKYIRTHLFIPNTTCPKRAYKRGVLEATRYEIKSPPSHPPFLAHVGW